MTVAVLPAMGRPLLEPALPADLTVRWFHNVAELEAMAPEAEIGWMDLNDPAAMRAAIGKATRLRWLNSIYAGIDGLPLEHLKALGTRVTNGAGINAITIAEYVVMGMLVVAKGYDDVLRARDRREWLTDAPGKLELAGTRAMVLGGGAIGSLVAERLRAFAVEVTVVRRTARHGAIGMDAWRARLPETDWLILTVPGTAETHGMVGDDELAALPATAALINVARGTVVDQDALVKALATRKLAAAFLDVTDPEPLPADHPLWSLPNAHISMHLSGRSQTKMFTRSTQRFLDNLARFRAGEPLEHQVDLDRGC